MPKKTKKNHTQSKNHDEEEIDQLSQASNSMGDDMQPDDTDPSRDAHFSLILKEQREFRKDSSQQLNGIKEDINKINKRMEEAEERIDAAETRIHSWEEVQTEVKLTDLEGRTRRENVRIYGVKEGAEAMSTSVIGLLVYNSAEEATADMVKRGIPVTVLKNPSSLLDQINRLTWEPSRKRGDQQHPSSQQDFKERLRGFRHQDT
ncbi:IQ domain containing protein E [Dissostichus eleginoides]|uniref:IQ domain containing protein E n=1 Tax=Dissostichus eleginoides TaxID=100907 RepID=A0AAD9BWC9_DISEL|nr:IQ domain containing protein E [Dissostichus eleginoides]